MIQTSTRPERRRMYFQRPQQGPVRMAKHIGPSKYMPHIGAKQRAKASAPAPEGM